MKAHRTDSNQQRIVDIVLAAERALHDFERNMARIYAHKLQSPLEPFTMTESELWVLNELRSQLRKAQDLWYEYLSH